MTQSGTLDTYFAPAERAERDQLLAQVAVVSDQALFLEMLEAMPCMTMVLNGERQIVAGNQRLLDVLELPDIEPLIGQRPGEALGCFSARECPGGCGTGYTCTTCGAVHSILESMQQGHRITRECQITIDTGRPVALDMEVTSTPVKLEGAVFVVCALRDISAEKRRRILERTFFHDVLNTASGLRGFARLLVSSDGQQDDEDNLYRQQIFQISNLLVEEIDSHKQLMAAESGELKLRLEDVSIPALLRELHGLYSNHEVSRERQLTLLQEAQGSVVTDRALLRRVLSNLIKNALEATPLGGTATFGCERTAEGWRFTVQNPAVMEREVQLRLFKRSFSTKGVDRGIGTYSIKLFGEQYLRGRVSFTSEQGAGTTFTFLLPDNATESG